MNDFDGIDPSGDAPAAVRPGPALPVTFYAALSAGLVVLFALTVMVTRHLHAAPSVQGQAPLTPDQAVSVINPDTVSRNACIRLWLTAPEEARRNLDIPTRKQVEAQPDEALRTWLKNTVAAQDLKGMTRAQLIDAVVASLPAAAKARAPIAATIQAYEATCTARWPSTDRLAAKLVLSHRWWLFSGRV